MKNPDWTRDELILALDFYMRRPGISFDKRDPDVVKLSELIRFLPIRDGEQGATFRNISSVVFKLGNFKSIDFDAT